MLTFMEFLAEMRTMTLPPTHMMLSMAGVGLDSPNEEETRRLLNSERKRQPAHRRDAHRTINRLDSLPAPASRGRP